MLEAFQSFIKSHDLFTRSDKLLVAVSGGVDSMVLLHLLHAAEYRIEVAHMNFQLRGEASDGDEASVQRYCGERAIPFHVERVDTKQFADDEGVSTQMAARSLRFEWFKEVMERERFQYLLTAHQAEDSLETALFNFTKGTGIAGLVGIKAKADWIRRPLLFAQKAEIEEYASIAGVSWREDASNQETQYMRNKLRHQVLPVLKEINPSVVSHFSDTQMRLSGVQELLRDAVRELKANELKPGEGGFILGTGWLCPDDRCLVLLAELLREFSFSFRQSEQVFQAIGGESGKVFESATHRINWDRSQLLIHPKATQAEIFEPLLINVSDEIVTRPGFQLRIDLDVPWPSDWAQVEKTEAYFDYDKLQFPLLLRTWTEGDTFTPLGMQGSKKVSDLLIDHKVPLMSKHKVMVLLSGGEITWVVGYQPGEQDKVSSTTRRLIKITLSLS